MTDTIDYVSLRLERRLAAVGASMADLWAHQEIKGTKYASGWDESFGFPNKGEVVGIGANGELSAKYGAASNEFWAGHSSTLEDRVELENFLCNPRIRQGAATSMWDVVQRKLFRGDMDNISAHVGGVMDEELRLSSPWIVRDLPALLESPAVKKIHLIDDVTGHVTTVDRKEAIALFNKLMKDEEFESRASESLWEHQVKLIPTIHEVEEAMKTASEMEKPWLEVELSRCQRELGLSVKEYALRQFAGDLDGARVYIARQDLEGNFDRPEQPDELRKYQMSIDLQNQGALITTLEAPRHGLSFDELKERTDFQTQIEALKNSFNRDLEIITSRIDSLAGRDKAEVKEERDELATAMKSLRREIYSFTDLIALSEQAQVGLDLERRMVLAEAINTDTHLGRHLQEDAYLSSQLQTLTDEVLTYERAKAGNTPGQAPEGEIPKLHERIAELREQLVEHGHEKVPLDDLNPKLRARYEQSLLAQKHSLEVHDSLEKHFTQWRDERGILELGSPDFSEDKRVEKPFKLRASLQKIAENNESRVNVEGPAKTSGVLPPLNAEQRKRFSQNMHVLINEVVGTVILNIMPAASSATDTTLAIRDAKTMVQSMKRAKDPDATPLERLEAKFEAEMAKMHVAQQVVSAGVALIPLVGIPATTAIGLANLVYDCVKGNELSKVKDNLLDVQEPPVWRKPSERRPAPTPCKKETEADADYERLVRGKDRGFTAFTTERWAVLIKEKEERASAKAAEQETVKL